MGAIRDKLFLGSYLQAAFSVTRKWLLDGIDAIFEILYFPEIVHGGFPLTGRARTLLIGWGGGGVVNLCFEIAPGGARFR